MVSHSPVCLESTRFNASAAMYKYILSLIYFTNNKQLQHIPYNDIYMYKKRNYWMIHLVGERGNIPSPIGGLGATLRAEGIQILFISSS